MTTKIRLNVLLNTTERTQLELAKGLMTSGQGPGPPKWGGGAQSWALCRGYMLCVRLQRQTSTCLKVEETCLSAPALDGKKKRNLKLSCAKEVRQKVSGPAWNIWTMVETGTNTHEDNTAPRPAGTHRPAERRAQASTAGPVC